LGGKFLQVNDRNGSFRFTSPFHFSTVEIENLSQLQVCPAQQRCAKVSPHANAARSGVAFVSISALGNPSQEPITDGGLMVPRTGVTVDICPRDLPTALIGMAGGALALWANAPVEIVIPTALLIVLDIRVRRWRRRA
jgi:hypothetical protein